MQGWIESWLQQLAESGYQVERSGGGFQYRVSPDSLAIIAFDQVVYADGDGSVMVSGTVDVIHNAIERKIKRMPPIRWLETARATSLVRADLGVLLPPHRRGHQWKVVDGSGDTSAVPVAALARGVSAIFGLLQEDSSIGAILSLKEHGWQLRQPAGVVGYACIGEIEKGIEEYIDSDLRGPSASDGTLGIASVRSEIVAALGVLAVDDEEAVLANVDAILDEIARSREAREEEARKAEEARQQKFARNAERDKHRKIPPLVVRKPLRKRGSD